MALVLDAIHSGFQDLKRLITSLIVVNTLVLGAVVALALYGLTRDSEFEKTRAVSVNNQAEIKCILRNLGPKTTPGQAIDTCETATTTTTGK